MNFSEHFYFSSLNMFYNCVYALSPLIFQSTRIYSKHHWMDFRLRCIVHMKTTTRTVSQDCYYAQQMPNTFVNICSMLIHFMPKNTAYVMNMLYYNIYCCYCDYYFMTN